MGIGRKDPIGFQGYAEKPAYEMRGYKFYKKENYADNKVQVHEKKTHICTCCLRGHDFTLPTKMRVVLLVSFDDTLH